MAQHLSPQPRACSSVNMRNVAEMGCVSALGDARKVKTRSPRSSALSRRFYRPTHLFTTFHPPATLLTTTHLFASLRRTMSLSISAMPTHRPIPSWRTPVIGRNLVEDVCTRGHPEYAYHHSIQWVDGMTRVTIALNELGLAGRSARLPRPS